MSDDEKEKEEREQEKQAALWRVRYERMKALERRLKARDVRKKK
jgi:hypothetical protein